MASRTFHILHVDDDENERLFIARAVERSGLPIGLTSASSGLEALSSLRSGSEVRPDLILLDIRMPMMSGFEFFEQLQKSGGCHPAVMMFSNSSEPVDIQRSQELGTAGYLVKPQSLGELGVMLHRLYERFSASQSTGNGPCPEMGKVRGPQDPDHAARSCEQSLGA